MIETAQTANWLTAREMLNRIASGALTSRDLVAACLERWRQRDGTVHAWTHLEPDAALARAQAADAQTHGALRGLPIGVKDIIFTRDMPTSYNSPHFQDHFPNIDAASVSILRTAGAVMLGKNDTVEFAVNGRRAATTNPHDPTRTPGGSSSGSAAAVADGQVPIALGTQTGGSVIRPASYCGVYAIKPTWNLVSHEGFKVCAASFDTLGWYARSADDLDLIAEVFGIEALPAAASLAQARIAICRSPVWNMAEPATVAAMAEAESRLRASGAKLVELDLPAEFAGLTAAHGIIMQAEMRTSFLADYRNLGDALYPQLVSVMNNAAGHTRAALLAALDLAAACRAKFDHLAGGFDAVLTPSTSGEAPIGPEDTGAATFNRIWTLIHAPCVNVPGLIGPSGLPVGLTLTGPRYSDRRLIAMAGLLGALLSPVSHPKPTTKEARS